MSYYQTPYGYSTPPENNSTTKYLIIGIVVVGLIGLIIYLSSLSNDRVQDYDPTYKVEKPTINQLTTEILGDGGNRTDTATSILRAQLEDNLSQSNIPGFMFCAEENSMCTLTAPQTVWYFDAESKSPITSSLQVEAQPGIFTCSNAVFNGDPAPGRKKMCYYTPSMGLKDGWKYCGVEPQTCTLPPNQEVRILANNNSNPDIEYAKTFPGDGLFRCHSDAFGFDPAYGNLKKCIYKPATGPQAGFYPCANEYGTCSAKKNTQMYYYDISREDPLGGNLIIKSFPEGSIIGCNNNEFNGDPSDGKTKICRYKINSNPFIYAADHQQSMTIPGPAEVTILHHERDPNIETNKVSRYVPAGTYDCYVDGIFNGYDPAYGSHKKCYYKLLK